MRLGESIKKVLDHNIGSFDQWVTTIFVQLSSIMFVWAPEPRAFKLQSAGHTLPEVAHGCDAAQQRAHGQLQEPRGPACSGHGATSHLNRT